MGSPISLHFQYCFWQYVRNIIQIKEFKIWIENLLTVKCVVHISFPAECCLIQTRVMGSTGTCTGHQQDTHLPPTHSGQVKDSNQTHPHVIEM